MSRQSAARFQALADIPADSFERALRAPEKPTTSGLLKHVEARRKVNDPIPMPRVNDEALFLWGHLRDFERHGMLAHGWRPPWNFMTDAMLADIRRLAPRVIEFLSTLEATP